MNLANVASAAQKPKKAKRSYRKQEKPLIAEGSIPQAPEPVAREVSPNEQQFYTGVAQGFSGATRGYTPEIKESVASSGRPLPPESARGLTEPSRGMPEHVRQNILRRVATSSVPSYLQNPANWPEDLKTKLTDPESDEAKLAAYDQGKYGMPTFGYVSDPDREQYVKQVRLTREPGNVYSEARAMDKRLAELGMRPTPEQRHDLIGVMWLRNGLKSDDDPVTPGSGKDIADMFANTDSAHIHDLVEQGKSRRFAASLRAGQPPAPQDIASASELSKGSPITGAEAARLMGPMGGTGGVNLASGATAGLDPQADFQRWLEGGGPLDVSRRTSIEGFREAYGIGSYEKEMGLPPTDERKFAASVGLTDTREPTDFSSALRESGTDPHSFAGTIARDEPSIADADGFGLYARAFRAVLPSSLATTIRQATGTSYSELGDVGQVSEAAINSIGGLVEAMALGNAGAAAFAAKTGLSAAEAGQAVTMAQRIANGGRFVGKFFTGYVAQQIPSMAVALQQNKYDVSKTVEQTADAMVKQLNPATLFDPSVPLPEKVSAGINLAFLTLGVTVHGLQKISALKERIPEDLGPGAIKSEMDAMPPEIAAQVERVRQEILRGLVEANGHSLEDAHPALVAGLDKQAHSAAIVLSRAARNIEANGGQGALDTMQNISYHPAKGLVAPPAVEAAIDLEPPGLKAGDSATYTINAMHSWNPELRKGLVQLGEGATVAEVAHETAHYVRRILPPDLLAAVQDSLGIRQWDIPSEERFARAFEMYLTQRAVEPGLEPVMARIALAVRDIYASNRRLGGGIRGHLKKTLGREPTPEDALQFHAGATIGDEPLTVPDSLKVIFDDMTTRPSEWPGMLSAVMVNDNEQRGSAGEVDDGTVDRVRDDGPTEGTGAEDRGLPPSRDDGGVPPETPVPEDVAGEATPEAVAPEAEAQAPVAKEPWQMTKSAAKDTLSKALADAENYAKQFDPPNEQWDNELKDSLAKAEKEYQSAKSAWERSPMPSETMVKRLAAAKEKLADLKERSGRAQSDNRANENFWKQKERDYLLGHHPDLFESRAEWPFYMGSEKYSQLHWHKDAVKQALKEGKPVPPEVLADYPDLAGRTEPNLTNPEQKSYAAKPEAESAPTGDHDLPTILSKDLDVILRANKDGDFGSDTGGYRHLEGYKGLTKWVQDAIARGLVETYERENKWGGTTNAYRLTEKGLELRRAYDRSLEPRPIEWHKPGKGTINGDTDRFGGDVGIVKGNGESWWTNTHYVFKGVPPKGVSAGTAHPLTIESTLRVIPSEPGPVVTPEGTIGRRGHERGADVRQVVFSNGSVIDQGYYDLALRLFGDVEWHQQAYGRPFTLKKNGETVGALMPMQGEGVESALAAIKEKRSPGSTIPEKPPDEPSPFGEDTPHATPLSKQQDAGRAHFEAKGIPPEMADTAARGVFGNQADRAALVGDQAALDALGKAYGFDDGISPGIAHSLLDRIGEIAAKQGGFKWKPQVPEAPPVGGEVVPDELPSGTRDSVEAGREVLKGFLANQWGQDHPNLAAQLREGAKSVWHETSLEGLRRMMPRLEGRHGTGRQIYVSDNPDLALGQGGKGVIVEFDPTRVNGHPDRSKPSAGFMEGEGQGGEFVIDTTTVGSVRSLTFKSQRQFDAAAKTDIATRFDFGNPETTDSGIKVSRLNPREDLASGERRIPGLQDESLPPDIEDVLDSIPRSAPGWRKSVQNLKNAKRDLGSVAASFFSDLVSELKQTGNPRARDAADRLVNARVHGNQLSATYRYRLSDVIHDVYAKGLDNPALKGVRNLVMRAHRAEIDDVKRAVLDRWDPAQRLDVLGLEDADFEAWVKSDPKILGLDGEKPPTLRQVQVWRDGWGKLVEETAHVAWSRGVGVMRTIAPGDMPKLDPMLRGKEVKYIIGGGGKNKAGVLEKGRWVGWDDKKGVALVMGEDGVVRKLKPGDLFMTASLLKGMEFFPQKLKDSIMDALQNPESDIYKHELARRMKAGASKDDAARLIRAGIEPVTIEVPGRVLTRVERPRLPSDFPPEFYESDFSKIADQHLDEVANRIAQAEHLGPDMGLIADDLAEASGGNGNLLRDWAGKVQGAMGHGAMNHPQARLYRNALSGYAAAKLLTTLTGIATTLKQPTSLVMAAAVHNPASLPHALWQVLNPGWWDTLHRLGVLTSDQANLHGLDFAGKAKDVTSAGLKGVGVTLADQIPRVMAADMGVTSTRYAVTRLAQIPEAKWEGSRHYRLLHEFGNFSRDEIGKMVERAAANGGVFTFRDPSMKPMFTKAASAGVQTQGVTDPINFPDVVNRHPVARGLMLLNSFNYLQAKNVGHVLNEASSGNIGPLVTLMVGGTIAGQAVMKGLTELEKHKQLPIWFKFFKAKGQSDDEAKENAQNAADARGPKPGFKYATDVDWKDWADAGTLKQLGSSVADALSITGMLGMYGGLLDAMSPDDQPMSRTSFDRQASAARTLLPAPFGDIIGAVASVGAAMEEQKQEEDRALKGAKPRLEEKPGPLQSVGKQVLQQFPIPGVGSGVLRKPSAWKLAFETLSVENAKLARRYGAYPQPRQRPNETTDAFLARVRSKAANWDVRLDNLRASGLTGDDLRQAVLKSAQESFRSASRSYSR